MIRQSAAHMAIIAAIAASATPVHAEGPMSVSFAETQIGALPPGFAIERTGSGAPAEWKIVADDMIAGRRVLAQTSSDRTDYRFPLAIY